VARRDHWDEVLRRVGGAPPTWFQPEPVLSLGILDELGVTVEHSVLDVGAGTSTLVDRLVARGHDDVTALDVSSAALDVTRRRLGPDATRVAWVVADVCAWTPPRTYDVWHDRAVLHFLTDAEDRARYLATLRSATAVGASIVLATFALDGPDSCSGLPVLRYDHDGLAALLGPDVDVLVRRQEDHTTPSGATQPFTWIGAVRRR
jgi:2-polyprenyl-3-methyl-5-hydroxy-6-metoxy-1,4-benzoquinol methylase